MDANQFIEKIRFNCFAEMINLSKSPGTQY